MDRSNGEQAPGDGKPITLNGVVYQRGFGVHALNEMSYSLQNTGEGNCTSFTVDMGVDDEVGIRGSVVFQIYLDGALSFSSGIMTGASATKYW